MINFKHKIHRLSKVVDNTVRTIYVHLKHCINKCQSTKLQPIDSSVPTLLSFKHETKLVIGGIINQNNGYTPIGEA